MALIRGLFWFVLFVVFTFSFVVLFEYGPGDFVSGFKKEFARATNFVEETIHKPAKKEEKP